MEVYGIGAIAVPIPKEPRDEREACAQFEALLIQKLLEAMDRTVPRSTLFPRKRAEEFYRLMWYEAVAEEVAKEGGVGLGERLLQYLQGAKVFSR
ncbi:MAG: hypothetical protein DRG32_00970 [Deltaproteobacteria bacterium]|nr:MAG: hypothetical protein DRG32_00970 [Deltaproteobacteria bacterium]